MNQSQQDLDKEKIYKIYVILFIILTLLNIVLFVVEGSIIRGIITLIVFSVVLYYGLQKIYWAEIIIKYMVWVYIVIIIIILLLVIYKLFSN